MKKNNLKNLKKKGLMVNIQEKDFLKSNINLWPYK